MTVQTERAARTRRLWAARAELARRDPNAFASFVMSTPEGEPWVQQPFHRVWQHLLPEVGPARVLIGAPRESAKSSQMAVARVLWELGRKPNLRIRIITATDDLAFKLVAEIRQHIEGNPRLHLSFPRLRAASGGPWARGQLQIERPALMKDSSVEGSGVLTSGVGGRADLLICDDVCDQRNTILLPALRDQVKSVFYETWLNLLGPEGRAVHVATAWHEDDLTCNLRRNPEWRVWWQPALDPETGAVLWPEKWSREALAAREREIGPRAFSRQYLLQPLSEEESVFPERVLQVCREPRWEPGQVEVPDHWPRFIGVDLASSLGAKAAYTVAFVIATDPESRRRYPLEIVRGRMKFDETVELLVQLWLRHRPIEIRVENNAYQEALLQHLREKHPAMPVQGHTTGRQKADEAIGLPGLATVMANGGWAIPCAGEPHPISCECVWCAWIHELRAYPLGRYSDVVMAMWFAEAAAYEQGQHSFADVYQPYF